jgi:hypothetical protein
MSKGKLDKILKDHLAGVPFSAQEIVLSSEDCKLWVQFKVEPQRFLPKVFDGDWAMTQKNPSAGSIRIIRIITGNDEVTRAIARQGNKIYAYPWIG